MLHEKGWIEGNNSNPNA